jgi:MoaA/NifB/PqqE/SkfB family radical SAM enzyme
MNTLEQLKHYKIKNLQLDPNGSCNAGCWFCPVRYVGNPEEAKNQMSPDLLDKIFNDIVTERDTGGLVHKNFNGFYASHYNEVLLYKHFEELLQTARKYKLIFMVLSNGTPLTPAKTDLLIKYKDVLSGICLNVPCFEPELWSKRVNLPEKIFPKLIDNINYFIKNHPMKVSIQVNGYNANNNWTEKGENFPVDITNEENEKQFELAKAMFPEANVFKMFHLVDRAGHIANVITNKTSIDRNYKDKQVIGCLNDNENGGRPIGWLHINANGECFLCCNDYDMDVKFGDFKTQNLKDFWLSDYHVEQIDKSYNTICKSCASAKFKT